MGAAVVGPSATSSAVGGVSAASGLVAGALLPAAGAGSSAGATGASGSSGAATAAAVLPPVPPRPRGLEHVALFTDHLRTLNEQALKPVWDILRAMSWRAWPRERDGGNPFVVKITRTNKDTLGVPEYFKTVSTPMDLTRMAERMAGKGGAGGRGGSLAAAAAVAAAGGPAFGYYNSAHEFLNDALLIAANAKRYNCPAIVRGAAVPPHPSLLPPEARDAVYVMAWEFEAKVMDLAAGLVADWAAKEAPLLADAARMHRQMEEQQAEAARRAAEARAQAEALQAALGGGAGAGSWR